MFLALAVVVSAIFFAEIVDLYLIGVMLFLLFMYLYPVGGILLLVCVAVWRWKGTAIIQSLKSRISNRRKLK